MDQSWEKERVLVVDDEVGPRESLRMILSPQFDVATARSGAEALAILSDHPIDLVTLDLNMPGMSGEDVMRALHSEFPDVATIVVTGSPTLESATDGIRYGICDYLQKPFDVVRVNGAVTRAMARSRARKQMVRFLGELGRLVGRDKDASAILEAVERSQNLRGQLGDLLSGERSALEHDGVTGSWGPTQTVEFLEVLAETIETKDRFMRGHARRVSFYASLMAHRVSLSDEQHEHVRIAAFLHDLGKVGVPTELLRRPGALDDAERAIVEGHPEAGARLLKPLAIHPDVALAVHHHHEWWDGSGYPGGLSGNEIPLAARIIGIADAFDAMSSNRPYRNALSRDEVVAELRRFAGVQFDVELTKEFLAILETGVCEIDPELLAVSVEDASCIESSAA